jgi:hypothetical protein
VKLANAVPASLEPLCQLDLKYSECSIECTQLLRILPGSDRGRVTDLAPEIVSRMDSMRTNLVGSKQRELRTFEARWQQNADQQLSGPS